MIKVVPPCTDRVEVEAANYLSTAKELDCLHNYPIIKSLFLKCNTTLPCSAPVERLLSLGKMLLTPKRSRRVDAKRLLLKCCKKHFLQVTLILLYNTSYDCNYITEVLHTSYTF